METFNTIDGKIKYLFSAPHPYPHRRPSLARKYKEKEEYTDDIVKAVCKKTKAFGIYTKDQVDYDPNYHRKNNPYKEEVEKIVNENKIEQFIDIHGLCDEHMIDIAIYYKSRFSNSIKLAKKVMKSLNQGQLRGLNIQIFRLPENRQESLTEFGASTLRVPAVQIEIARYIRKDKELREEFVKNLADIISKK
jgi:hypothetical protein